MNHTKAIVYGLIIWALGFIFAMLLFPLRTNERALFESIMPVGLTLAVTYGSLRYFRSITKKHVFIGLCLGIIWMIVSLVLDGLMFSWGPMKMSLYEYIKDIGLTYCIILIIPIGIGYALEYKNQHLKEVTQYEK